MSDLRAMWNISQLTSCVKLPLTKKVCLHLVTISPQRRWYWNDWLLDCCGCEDLYKPEPSDRCSPLESSECSSSPQLRQGSGRDHSENKALNEALRGHDAHGLFYSFGFGHWFNVTLKRKKYQRHQISFQFVGCHGHLDITLKVLGNLSVYSLMCEKFK